MTDNPWGALQAQGVEATDQAPAGGAIAYADVDDRGRQVVGFDSAMVLPRLCFKCGTSDVSGEISLKFRALADWTQKLAAAADGRPLAAQKVGPGKYALTLPYCASCTATRTRGQRLRIVTLLWPVVIIGLGLAANAISESITAPVVLAAIAAWAGLAIAGASARKKGNVEVDRIDGDGIVRLVRVHGDAAEAVVAAAQRH